MFRKTPSLPPFILGRFGQRMLKAAPRRLALLSPRQRLRSARLGALSCLWVLVLLCGAAPVAQAHEFWIDPLAYRVAPGAKLEADIRIGTKLKGARYSYNPMEFRRFELVQNGKSMKVQGRAGDRPALAMAAPDEGLVTVVHVTRDNRLSYPNWEKFETFCTEKDFRWALEAHLERGLPRENFREIYSRHAKSLMAAGHGRGADVKVGLLTEIVAEANPYTDDLSAGLPVRVFYDGAPRANVQVEVFARAPNGNVRITRQRTDGNGRARIAVKPGHAYLVDSVVMRPITPKSASDPVWESLWASLTFAVPG